MGGVPSAVDMAGESDHVLRAGWYAVEGTGRDCFRWTERECTFLLSLDGSTVHLEAGVTRPAGAPVVDVRLVSLGREFGCVRVDTERPWRELTIPVPPDFPRGPAHLRLIVSDFWRPADTGDSVDRRALGLRIKRIWCAAGENGR